MPAEDNAAETQIVVEYRRPSTALQPEALDQEIRRVWGDLLRSDKGRARVGRVLGVDPASLRPDAGPIPFAVEQGEAGIDGITLAVAIHWAAVNLVVPVLIGLAKDEVKARLVQLWRQVIKPAIDGEGEDKFGDELPPGDRHDR